MSYRQKHKWTLEEMQAKLREWTGEAIGKRVSLEQEVEREHETYRAALKIFGSETEEDRKKRLAIELDEQYQQQILTNSDR